MEERNLDLEEELEFLEHRMIREGRIEELDRKEKQALFNYYNTLSQEEKN